MTGNRTEIIRKHGPGVWNILHGLSVFPNRKAFRKTDHAEGRSEPLELDF